MKIINRAANSLLYRFSQKFLLGKFDFWESVGVHIVQNNYYSSIPNLADLRIKVDSFEKHHTSDMGNFDWNEQTQSKLIEDIFPLYFSECCFPLTKEDRKNEWDYFVDNGSFPIGDACLLHCMIKHFSPKRIIEIGSGFSTLVMARAASHNKQEIEKQAQLVSINPFPGEFEELFTTGFPGFSKLIKEPVEDMDLAFFDKLEANDILFIDSSHVIRPMGDVAFLYLNVIPRLKPGVIIHSHDIFLPRHMPKEWIFQNKWFWNEQYLLWAFLSFNKEFEVLFSAQYMKKYVGELQSIFPGYWAGGSFWFRRKN